MKRSITLFVAACCATIGWTQTAQNQTPASPAPAATTASTSSPEAIAAKDPSKVVATVNGQSITAKQANDLLKMIPAEQRRTNPNLERLFEQLYAMTQLADQAQKDRLDQDPAVESQIQFSRTSVLAQAYMNKLTAAQSGGPVDPKQYYDTHKDEFDTAKLSGIAIAFTPPGTPANPNGPNRTEQEAQAKADDIEKKIKAGADLTTLARTESDDQRSATQGGSLGTLTPSAPGIPTDLKNVVFNKLQPGQVSEPVRVQNAYYIIKLDSRAQQPYEQVKASIEQKLKGEKTQSILKQELDKYKVQVQDPDFFGTTTPAKTPSLGAPGTVVTPTQPGAKK
jgi:EpsD family peptidyl-prolyl cis-trans isomerase